ncbi:phosphate ABC transporter membrane protein 1 (PhoT family) [Melghiribacillus thermohalophilus]|uniref:Phosphate transport system permease protein n=1 Tax=Melghiribacillus thermohalophilus TaxID=1324956 RepID=A0A4R3NBF1_9BACI|nr:phosphate ABC transporter permease subunit PstC [Melghiribacillus thermohalophilus]TCT26979.1 phosphate ABC transporter membrane protein 1 (PhoT family) [Melghiribacillus thermohalophilus]
MESAGSLKKKPLDVQEKIRENKEKQKMFRKLEKLVPVFLFLSAAFSVMTTLGILFTLLKEAVGFFSVVPVKEFFFNTSWKPWSGSFGVLPLITGTLLITFIAISVALPLGIAAAIFLSEYANSRVRKVIKPTLEVLAGIPTVVYGFFALTFVTPILEKFIPELQIFNALSAGIVVGIMIIPMVASLSEDAMNAVPNSLREGALAMGSTKFEVAMKVVLPAAFSGVVASVVLAISRAIGETMIVTIAAGQSPNFTFDPTMSIQTLTAFIVQGTSGDTTYGSTIYYSVYAVGITLFVFTLAMNLLAQYIARRFREEY